MKNKHTTLLLTALLVTALLLSSVIPGFAANKIEIDGKMGTAEWSSAKHTVIFPYNSQSNCAINYAFMAYLAKPEERALFLCFNLSQKHETPLDNDDSQIGVKLTFYDNSRYFFSVDGCEDLPDPSKISPQKAFRFGTDNDLVIEMRLAFLTGLPDFPLKSVQFCDSKGGFSNLYTLENSAQTSPTATSAATTKPSATDTAKPTTTKPQKFKVRFDSNGGRGGKTFNWEAGTIPAPPTVTRSGYVFSGWQPEIVPVNGDRVYTAVWTKQRVPKSSDIYYDTQGIPNSDDRSEEDHELDSATLSEVIQSDSSSFSDSVFGISESTSHNSSDNKAFGLGQIIAIALASILIALAVFIFSFALSSNKTKNEVKKSKAD